MNYMKAQVSGQERSVCLVFRTDNADNETMEVASIEIEGSDKIFLQMVVQDGSVLLKTDCALARLNPGQLDQLLTQGYLELDGRFIHVLRDDDKLEGLVTSA